MTSIIADNCYGRGLKCNVMANVNKFLNTLDIFYCESYEPIDFGYGAGYAGIYAELFPNTFNGNGVKGVDRYGKGDYVFKSGFGDGNANCSNDIKNKGYGKPCNKNCGICKHIR